MRKELEITIKPDGRVEIVTHGFKGKACLDAVAPFEQTVGQVVRRELTSEYYEQEAASNLQRRWRR